MVVLALGCSADTAREPHFDNTEMRTVDEVEADGSCGCEAGYRLVCDGAEGVVVLEDFCVPSPANAEVPDTFGVPFTSQSINGVADACSHALTDPLDASASGAEVFNLLYCERI